MLGFLASFLSVVAACVALVRWLDTQDVSSYVIALVVVTMATALWALTLIIENRASPDIKFRGLRGPWVPLAFGVAGLAVAYLGFEIPIVGVLIAAAVFVLAAGPLVFDLYEVDKASRKPCPDCCESVKVGARVCRYCGHRWPQAPALPPNHRPD
jgi:hypothetical protein